jgi:predicted amidophosphoribosyltransferase
MKPINKELVDTCWRCRELAVVQDGICGSCADDLRDEDEAARHADKKEMADYYAEQMRQTLLREHEVKH